MEDKSAVLSTLAQFLVTRMLIHLLLPHIRDNGKENAALFGALQTGVGGAYVCVCAGCILPPQWSISAVRVSGGI